ncbi:MAG: hypothetical protein KF745_04185 [Phycisphaeraceae bacterium]|nr:hypothetical protein [Phycisphaeraceae bacterium]
MPVISDLLHAAGQPLAWRRSLAAAVLLALPAGALADDNPVILEWFETRWQTIEARMPDYFVSGYDAVWLPPVSKASDPTSPGYDPFDRFDLGTPNSPTLYGTEADFRAMIAEFHRAGAQVYVDSIMNHNSGRTSNSGFIAAGAWPGFYLPGTGPDFWGDFHDGTQQSENPGGANYSLWNGDLVGLIDIAHEKNYQYIRHPIAADPLNIPAGTVYNRPNAANTRLYPDLQLVPSPGIQDPGLPTNQFRNPATNQVLNFTVFNTADPAAGDPVAENAVGLLIRWTQWMLDDLKVDGFRLDAAKHIPPWFWTNYWDNAPYKRRLTPGGSRATAFSFVESVESNSFTYSNYIRKDGFGNRDALDLNGAGALRDIHGAGGFGSWQNVLSAFIDLTDDGFQNGSIGITHVYSHDNGSTAGSPPPLPGPSSYALPEHALILTRPGISIVYHNGREFTSIPSRGFWPKEGNPTALGSDPNLVRLVQVSNGYARGEYNPLNSTDPVNSSLADVLVFERRTPLGGGGYAGNLLVAVNDRADAGVQQRSVQTSFPPGTRLHELTGAWNDPVVNPAAQIPELLVTDANRRVLITVPNNTSTAGAHYRGYVAYGPSAPAGTLTIQGATAVIPPDSASVPSYSRRLTPVDVVTGPSFSILLSTTKADPSDPNWDDNALFRIDGGYADYNGNGQIDFGEGAGVAAGYEQFLTFNRPLFTNPTLPGGSYIQSINAAALDEGMHYLSVIAFRHRSDGGAPIYTDFRKAIYIDRSPPQVSLALPPAGELASTTYTFSVTAADRGTNRVHIILDLPQGSDPYLAANAGNQASRPDRMEYRRTISGMSLGPHTVTVVAFEPSGNKSAQTYNIDVVIGNRDVNRDGFVTIDDMWDFFTLTSYVPQADLDADGDNDSRDLRFLELFFRASEAANMVGGQR